jgi:hypothetical protein
MYEAIMYVLLLMALVAIMFNVPGCTQIPDYYEQYGLNRDAEEARYDYLNQFENYSPAERYQPDQPHESDGVEERNPSNFSH